MTADDHRQRSCRQTARHFDITRGVRTMISVVVMAHMGGRQNHIRFFIQLQLLDNQFGLVRRFAKFNVGEIFRVTYPGRVIGGQANNRDF